VAPAVKLQCMRSVRFYGRRWVEFRDSHPSAWGQLMGASRTELTKLYFKGFDVVLDIKVKVP